MDHPGTHTHRVHPSVRVSMGAQVTMDIHGPSRDIPGQLLPVVTTVDVRGQEPGAGPSTFVALSLIVRLAGTRSCGILERSPASRVGSQCATSGVSLHTWNILISVSPIARRRSHAT